MGDARVRRRDDRGRCVRLLATPAGPGGGRSARRGGGRVRQHGPVPAEHGPTRPHELDVRVAHPRHGRRLPPPVGWPHRFPARLPAAVRARCGQAGAAADPVCGRVRRLLRCRRRREAHGSDDARLVRQHRSADARADGDRVRGRAGPARPPVAALACRGPTAAARVHLGLCLHHRRRHDPLGHPGAPRQPSAAALDRGGPNRPAVPDPRRGRDRAPRRLRLRGRSAGRSSTAA